MRLIDADAFERRVMFDSDIEDLQDVIYALRDYESIADAVQVVRCKDCKWYKTNYSWNGTEHKVCVRESYEPTRKAIDYCSHGERRTE